MSKNKLSEREVRDLLVLSLKVARVPVYPDKVHMLGVGGTLGNLMRVRTGAGVTQSTHYGNTAALLTAFPDIAIVSADKKWISVHPDAEQEVKNPRPGVSVNHRELREMVKKALDLVKVPEYPKFGQVVQLSDVFTSLMLDKTGKSIAESTRFETAGEVYREFPELVQIRSNRVWRPANKNVVAGGITRSSSASSNSIGTNSYASESKSSYDQKNTAKSSNLLTEAEMRALLQDSIKFANVPMWPARTHTVKIGGWYGKLLRSRYRSKLAQCTPYDNFVELCTAFPDLLKLHTDKQWASRPNPAQAAAAANVASKGSFANAIASSSSSSSSSSSAAAAAAGSARGNSLILPDHQVRDMLRRTIKAIDRELLPMDVIGARLGLLISKLPGPSGLSTRTRFDGILPLVKAFPDVLTVSRDGKKAARTGSDAAKILMAPAGAAAEFSSASQGDEKSGAGSARRRGPNSDAGDMSGDEDSEDHDDDGKGAVEAPHWTQPDASVIVPIDPSSPDELFLESDLNNCRAHVHNMSRSVFSSSYHNRFIVVACQGRGQGRHGHVDVAGVGSRSLGVRLYDVLKEPRLMTDPHGLRAILENPRVLKVMMNCADTLETLYFQYGIRVSPVYDLQYCVEYFGSDSDVALIADALTPPPDAARLLYATDAWTARSLPEELLLYAAHVVRWQWSASTKAHVAALRRGNSQPPPLTSLQQSPFRPKPHEVFGRFFVSGMQRGSSSAWQWMRFVGKTHRPKLDPHFDPNKHVDRFQAERIRQAISRNQHDLDALLRIMPDGLGGVVRDEVDAIRKHPHVVDVVLVDIECDLGRPPHAVVHITQPVAEAHGRLLEITSRPAVATAKKDGGGGDDGGVGDGNAGGDGGDDHDDEQKHAQENVPGPHMPEAASLAGDWAEQNRTVVARQRLRLSDSVMTAQQLGRMADAVDLNGHGVSRLRDTLHRVSFMAVGEEPEDRRIVGFTARVGYTYSAALNRVRDFVFGQQRKSILVVGKRWVGKTNLLREFACAISDGLGASVSVVDSFGDLGGDAIVPHEWLGSARRFMVHSQQTQVDVIRDIVRQHDSDTLVVDDISTEAGVEELLSARLSGMHVVASVAHHSLVDVMQSPVFASWFGSGRQAFDMVVELVSRHVWRIYGDVATTAQHLRNNTPVACEERESVPLPNGGWALRARMLVV